MMLALLLSAFAWLMASKYLRVSRFDRVSDGEGDRFCLIFNNGICW